MSGDAGPVRSRNGVPSSLKIGGFLVALALVLTAAYAVGRLFPNEGPAAASEPTGESSGHGHGGSTDGETGGHGSGEGGDGHDHGGAVAGTSATEQGHTITLLTPTLAPGRQQVRFLITGPDGRPVTDYQEVHEKELHLIAVRDDLSGFNHVHPKRAADGTWETTLNLTPGTWRVYADSQPVGLTAQVVLAATLTVTGSASPVALPSPALTAEVDGYTVSLPASTGELWQGEQELAFTITRNGQPVTDLEPYLGAYAHVVVLRQRDLAYHHVHPEDGPAGPTVVAHAEFPTNGRYRAYVEFVHNGKIHRAEFTLEVS